jgi:hypothetical protein
MQKSRISVSVPIPLREAQTTIIVSADLLSACIRSVK